MSAMSGIGVFVGMLLLVACRGHPPIRDEARASDAVLVLNLPSEGRAEGSWQPATHWASALTRMREARSSPVPIIFVSNRPLL